MHNLPALSTKKYFTSFASKQFVFSRFFRWQNLSLKFQWTSAQFFDYNSQMEEKLVTIDNMGRILIPAAIRKALSILPGDRLVVRMENGTLRLLTRAQAIALAQALVCPHVSDNRSLAEELLAERRREAAED